MKNKIHTIRFKLIFTFCQSLFLSCICIFFLFILLMIASNNKPFTIFFNEHIISFFLLLCLLFILFTIVFFIIGIKDKLNYLEEITTAVQHVASGKLIVNIPIKGQDELAKLASSINFISHKFETLIEKKNKKKQRSKKII